MYRFVFILIFFLSPLSGAFVIEQNTTDADDCHCDIEVNVLNEILDELKQMKQRLIETEKRKLMPRTCLEVAVNPIKSGIYEILVKEYSDEPFKVFCDEGYHDGVETGGWTVIQRRVNGAVNFFRNWNDYQSGFGDLRENFWIGLDKLHALTNSCEHELYIALQRFEEKKPQYATYEKFAIGSEQENYNLTVLGDYKGNAGDSLKYHKNMLFSTFDHDLDTNTQSNCAQRFKGGWWYKFCYLSNLNGDYEEKTSGKGITWNTIKMDESLKFVQMMIRPTNNCIMRLQLKK